MQLSSLQDVTKDIQEVIKSLKHEVLICQDNLACYIDGEKSRKIEKNKEKSEKSSI